jgi:hypothetical protein
MSNSTVHHWLFINQVYHQILPPWVLCLASAKDSNKHVHSFCSLKQPPQHNYIHDVVNSIIKNYGYAISLLAYSLVTDLYESSSIITHLISSLCYFAIDGPFFTLYWACAQSFSLGQPHSFSRSGRAYSAHSTAETVNSEVFQDANGLVECKEGQWWCQQNKSKCVLFQLRLPPCTPLKMYYFNAARSSPRVLVKFESLSRSSKLTGNFF